ncbi:protein of unknown function DUF134 [Methanohalobium evestigatum Z-7303]|uniref:UPF0251 protein Metev_1173 n=1 Tax=Methanohalobium evestigatum (strain ATCC BAA-1072 / DSM 3721 / NBRC 107634 / OCM 161 / Z-7303) TaxID=644295 RepID=D7E9A5_METEZ|nr:DUF134 domain-containing protein [Methanohalobium evestigatum]ADI74053.1 protein of unknown function DUF134 [Methanohalobium evestigatum Z-7303]
MVRPKKQRIVDIEPEVSDFKPSGVPLSSLDEVNITIDELESLRLIYLENLNQTESARKMMIHQSTFQRISQQAIEKITNALINGKAIKIGGGNYTVPAKQKTVQRQGKGRHGFGGPVGTCICPDCGYEQSHQKGIPCNQVKCPECSKLMIRNE